MRGVPWGPEELWLRGAVTGRVVEHCVAQRGVGVLPREKWADRKEETSGVEVGGGEE